MNIKLYIHSFVFNKEIIRFYAYLYLLLWLFFVILLLTSKNKPG